jgi:ABC-type uncharacterized transport system auxiliary subunit
MSCVSSIALGACAGKVPQTRYYQLAAPATPAPSNSGLALVVETLDTDNAYDDDRIVYRLTPFRLDYYNYHRWSAPPGTLIGNFLEAAFESSGRFRTVTREPNPQAPAVLGGRVLALEEVDKSKTAWVGHVVIELRLTDATTGDVVWTQQFDETEPVTTQTPEGLAQALSKALDRIANTALPQIADHAIAIATANAAAKTAATAKTTSPSRSARLRP